MRSIASAYLRRGRGLGNQTLQPPEPINEAYLRLIDQPQPVQFENRAHFFGISARIMRFVLVETRADAPCVETWRRRMSGHARRGVADRAPFRPASAFWKLVVERPLPATGIVSSRFAAPQQPFSPGFRRNSLKGMSLKEIQKEDLPMQSVRLIFRSAAILLLPFLSCLAQQEETTVNITETDLIETTGIVHTKWVFTYNPPRAYDRVKRLYPNLYVLFRDYGPERSRLEINKDTLKIESDDAKRMITFTADVLGHVVSRRNRWQIPLQPNEQLLTQDGNKIITALQTSQPGNKISVICTSVLPKDAQNIRVDQQAHMITYTLPKMPAAGPIEQPQVDVSIRSKKRIMSALYKIYGDPEAGDGAYWVSKAIFMNTGKSPIYNVKITSRLGDIAESNIAEPYSEIAAGGSVVDCYYPTIQARAAQFKTMNPLQLFVRYEYEDASGKVYFGETTRRVEMLGINQFEFSNLNDEDRSDSWFDYFNNAPLLSAYVTKLDDVVKQFAGYVSTASGGADANISKEGAVRWLEAAYNMQLMNNVSYQTPSGFVTKDRSSGQDIKYPRDVLRDKAGTCVDLAITYAALAEAVGLRAYLMLVPGHAFAVIRLPGGDLMPVENTGLGGGNQRMTFQQAAEVGLKNLQKYYGDGVYYLVDVQHQLSLGRVPNPELPAVGNDFLEKSGIRRLEDMKFSRGPSQGNPAQGVAFRLVHDHFGNNLSAYCIGRLTVSGDSAAFIAESATDGRMDRFQFRKSEIVEVKKNRMPMGQFGRVMLPAFHVRFTNGANLNFALVNEQGAGLLADTVILALQPGH
ncbi:MAG: hypothetical protein HY820_43790 [Acidobacteria bacterium]|nr:hypothetical protein [Acidobacteriota bacterium]